MFLLCQFFHFCTVQDPLLKEWCHPQLASLPSKLNSIKLIQVIPADGPKARYGQSILTLFPSDSKLHLCVPLPNPLILEHSVKKYGECVLEHHIRSLNGNQNGKQYWLLKITPFSSFLQTKPVVSFLFSHLLVSIVPTQEVISHSSE